MIRLKGDKVTRALPQARINSIIAEAGFWLQDKFTFTCSPMHSLPMWYILLCYVVARRPSLDMTLQFRISQTPELWAKETSMVYKLPSVVFCYKQRKIRQHQWKEKHPIFIRKFKRAPMTNNLGKKKITKLEIDLNWYQNSAKW